MKYVVATTDNVYFRWQMLVQINNFKKMGLLDDLVYVVSVEKRRSAKLNIIEKETGVKIFTYKDEREKRDYLSSIRPHIMKKFLGENPEYGKAMFYLDPDVVFIEPLMFNNTIENSHVWFLSDTKSYLDSRYIKSKGSKLFSEMCEIVGINDDVVSRQDNNAGGAQYIMKNVDADYWNEVESNSEKLYKHLVNTSSKYNPEHPIQSWTTDMWTVLWGAWKLGHPTQIINELNFCWATDSIESWKRNKMYHNAGVFSQDYLFNKTQFTKKTPFNEDFSYVKKDFCSSKYVEEILDTKKNYPNLINKI